MRDIDEMLKIRHYKKADAEKIHAVIDELCRNGIAHGCYQDYAILVDILEVLAYFEHKVESLEE